MRLAQNNEQTKITILIVYDRLKVQQELIKDGNFDLKLPLKFKMNDENFELTQNIINNFNDQDVDFEHA